MPYPTIKLGSRGEAVTVAQKALIARYYSVGSAGADGVFGPYTLRAVLNYQSDREAEQYWSFNYPLVVDGVVGPQTWDRLAPGTIRNGSRGKMVELLQNILNSGGWAEPALKVDGLFGRLTEAAVKSFQSAFGLTVDGIVGPVTWRSFWS
jgi:peptidoglycan hydrolase-like protein with peptidoglycan-binding domain